VTTAALIAAQTIQRSIGFVIFTIVIVGGIFFAWSQLRKGRAEVGSEIELAPNRKPYLDDEELEGPKLNLALWSALGLLVIVALSLPLYWLGEEGRHAGAVEAFQEKFIERGLDIYQNKAQCEGCHGPKGSGGQASFVITDENGDFVQQVNWNAPALNTVLWRFSEAEVREILVYGRPGTPMQPWGVAGGGALSDQQIDNVIDYLWSVQLTNAEMQQQVMTYLEGRNKGLADRLKEIQEKNKDKLAKDPSLYDCSPGSDFACLSEQDNLLLGEILYGSNDLASGGYSCSRCHVGGASFGEAGKTVEEIARGRFAPNLVGVEKNLTVRQHFDLVMKGTEFGKIYGANQMGSGRMPGYGLNPNNGDTKVPQLGPLGMLTPEQVWAIVVYERNLTLKYPGATQTEPTRSEPSQ
jgi:mono/diheme cytochrome c family protein/cbb3-type cytochrome oxidase subunit 3